jgi:hypothetical protein
MNDFGIEMPGWTRRIAMQAAQESMREIEIAIAECPISIWL